MHERAIILNDCVSRVRNARVSLGQKLITDFIHRQRNGPDRAGLSGTWSRSRIRFQKKLVAGEPVHVRCTDSFIGYYTAILSFSLTKENFTLMTNRHYFSEISSLHIHSASLMCTTR